MARIEQAIEVNVPVRTAYRHLTQFEHYPRFMEDVEEVRQLDDTHLHWHTRAGNLDMEWDAEITQQVPDRCIAWRNINGPLYEGKIELNAKDAGRTEVRLTMECDPQQQVLAQHGDAQKAIAERTEQDLVRFKKFIEKLGRESHDWTGKIRDTEPLSTDAGAASGALEEGAAARPGPLGSERKLPPGQSQTGPVRGWPAGIRLPWMPDVMEAWRDPLSAMRRLSEDMDRMFGRAVGNVQPPASVLARSSGWVPPVETVEHGGRFLVCVELPGVKREDVAVEIRGNRLMIEGDRRPQPLSGPQESRRSERTYGHFCRAIDLPPGADAEAATASLQDGLLEVAIPLAPAGRSGRRIEIGPQA